MNLSEYFTALSDVTEWLEAAVIVDGQDTGAYEPLWHKPFSSGNQAKTKSFDTYFLFIELLSHEEVMQDKKSSFGDT